MLKYNPNEEYDFREDLKIDQNSLELEWAKNPLLFVKWAAKAIDVENQRDRLKDKLELMFAELDDKIRRDPEAYDLSETDRITERMVKSIIITREEYKDLKEAYQKAKYDASMLRVAVRSFRNREKSIDRLTKLYHDSYYCEASRGKTSSPQAEEKTTDHTANAQKALDASMKARKFIRNQ